MLRVVGRANGERDAQVYYIAPRCITHVQKNGEGAFVVCSNGLHIATAMAAGQIAKRLRALVSAGPPDGKL